MKNWMTFGFLRDSILRQNKIPDSAIPLLMQKGYINQVLMECWDQLDKANDPFYNRPVILSLSQRSDGVIIADLSQIYYKTVNHIKDETNNDYHEVLDPYTFYNAPNDYSNAAKITWFQQSSAILFWVGSRSGAMGTEVMAELRMKPALFTDATIASEIDVPPEHNTYLSDRVTELFCRHAGVAVPADVIQRNASYAVAASAAKDAVDAKQESKIKE